MQRLREVGGDPGDTLVVVISGWIKVLVRSADGGRCGPRS